MRIKAKEKKFLNGYDQGQEMMYSYVKVWLKNPNNLSPLDTDELLVDLRKFIDNAKK